MCSLLDSVTNPAVVWLLHFLFFFCSSGFRFVECRRSSCKSHSLRQHGMYINADLFVCLIDLPFVFHRPTVLTYDRTEEDDSSLPHIDGSYASRGSVLPPGILPHGMPQVKGKHFVCCGKVKV